MKNSDIPIIALGAGWLVVQKSPGMSIHNDPGRDLRSLLARKVKNEGSWQKKINFNPDYGFHAVGRLDKEADGLVLLAWRASVFAQLSLQYARHEIRKVYTVILQGVFKPQKKTPSAIQWSRPLSKSAGGRRNPAGKPPRVQCFTEVELLDRTSHFTLVHCRPQTGRKHQIRRHAALAGYPLAGDRRYGSVKTADRLLQLYGFDRIALHASSLTFKPPESQQMATISSSGVPAEFIHMLKMDSA